MAYPKLRATKVRLGASVCYIPSYPAIPQEYCGIYGIFYVSFRGSQLGLVIAKCTELEPEALAAEIPNSNPPQLAVVRFHTYFEWMITGYRSQRSYPRNRGY